MVAALHNELCRGEFHLLTTQVWLAHSIGRIAGALSQVPVVSFLTSASYDPLALRGFSRFTRLKTRAVQGADLLTGRLWMERAVAVSRFVAEYAVKTLRLPPARVTLIPNSVDV